MGTPAVINFKNEKFTRAMQEASRIQKPTAELVKGTAQKILEALPCAPDPASELTAIELVICLTAPFANRLRQSHGQSVHLWKEKLAKMPNEQAQFERAAGLLILLKKYPHTMGHFAATCEVKKRGDVCVNVDAVQKLAPTALSLE